MHLIRSIEIRYLRSIHRLRLFPLNHLVLLSGRNDVGKSNILKALNLFFNNDVGWQEPIEFYKDFSLKRLDEVRRESIKGRQFIRIDVEFLRPANYSGSLPERFKVIKTWYRDNPIPQETNNLDSLEASGKLPSTGETARRMLSQFMNRIKFNYVPAVREPAYFDHVLQSLQESLIATQMPKDDPILSAVRELNIRLGNRAGSLRDDFFRATQISADVSLPQDPYSLFGSLSVSTSVSSAGSEKVEENDRVSLSMRGDGIQARYIPSLLEYIAENSPMFHIWGFEEPENSVEYNLAIELADDFMGRYSLIAQIFITTHSPAFMTLESKRVASFRVHQKGPDTHVAYLDKRTREDEMHQLSEEIGLFKIQSDLYDTYIERRAEFQEMNATAERMRDELSQLGKPAIYVEGKNDVTTLMHAWGILYPSVRMPFVVKSCDPLDSSTGNSSAGVGMLAKLISTIPAHSPNIAVAMFDQDKEGIDSYENLPSYFDEHQSLDAKLSRSGRAAAFLLPIPPGKDKHAAVLNLEQEYYFSDVALTTRAKSGHGLTFRQPTISKKLDTHGSPVLDKAKSTLPYTREIVGGKTVFAEEILPLLPPHEFSNFKLIFDRLISIIAHLTH